MSRRFVVLALAAVAAATAGGALAKPPGGPQPDPESVLPVNPPLASLCQSPGSYPHPIALCSAVQVSCPSTAKAQFACKTVATVGTADANTRKLELVLPKRYSALTLICKAQSGVDIACRVSSRTSTKASGLRTSVLTLPRTASVRIGCATGKSAFACRIKN
ncbi:MAG TPA: hypothetical protein VHS03_12440 [Gaiellaceae bacterium]|jgi:hypothetical protein|nr:hypothetical protein [Gaiellaceae bacterium]